MVVKDMIDMQGDTRWMAHALELAKGGIGLASPNPTVGCVLVNARDERVGEGLHRYEFLDHAEVVALREAGGKARGATAYVTLEPCTHHGRTGPCSDALIAAGVTRVVIATLDANPVVRGHGATRLRDAGIAVEVGVMEAEAQRLNDAFAKYIRTRVPYVTLKAALSLDGRIAPAARGEPEPVWLTGEASRAEVHMMRHAHDALLTAVGTVLADDPLLTDRSGLPRRLPLLRVVLDSKLRMPLDSKLVETAGDGDVVVFTSSQDEERIGGFAARGVRIERVGVRSSGLAMDEVLARLGESGVSSVMIEGGTRINTSALGAGVVDRLVLFYAPRLLGAEGVPFVDSFDERVLSTPEVAGFGDDVCLSYTLKSYWER
jgi:diaminohydroxyphosphoribosylaminopyrimidine deaminase/5-amino-6-(5-phosphoribosylamino)uracil reductase